MPSFTSKCVQYMLCLAHTHDSHHNVRLYLLLTDRHSIRFIMAIDPDEQFRGAKDETNTAERFWIGVAAIRMAYLHFDVVSARKGDLLTVFKSQYKERGGGALVHDGDGGATSRWVIACNYLEVAASMGLSSAQFYLAELLRQKRVQHIGAQHSAELRALRLYMRAANSGFAEAQVRRCHFFCHHTTIDISFGEKIPSPYTFTFVLVKF